MISNHIALNMATKGIIGNSNSLATKGIISILITSTPLRKRKGVGVQGEKVNKKLIEVSLIYNNIEYKFKKIVNKKIQITADHIDIKIDESNKPTVIFKI